MLTTAGWFAIIVLTDGKGRAGVAQPVEQLICNQQVGGSNPSTSSSSQRTTLSLASTRA
jgi:hypothetical protein